MAEDIYLTNRQATSPRRGRPTIARRPKSDPNKASVAAAPKWWAFGVAGLLTLMLCVTINFRAFSNLNKESIQNSSLENEVQTMTSENLAIQEQIHYLKNDPVTVEREAKKFGLRRPKDKVSVPTNK